MILCGQGSDVLYASQVSFSDKPSSTAANGNGGSEEFAEETLNEPAAQES